MEDSIDQYNTDSSPKQQTLYRVLALSVLGLLAVAAVGGYLWWTNQVVEPVTEATPTLPQFAGQSLYLSAAPQGAATPMPQGYRMDMATGELVVALPYPVHSLQYVSSQYDAGIIYLLENGVERGIQPFWYDRVSQEFGLIDEVSVVSMQDLVVSPSGRTYAYSYQVNEQADDLQIQNWEIVIHNTETNEKALIPEATKPQWIHDGTGLVYMTADGLFLYSLMTGESARLVEGFQNLSRLDSIAVSPGSQYLVVTAPTLQQLVTFTIAQVDEVNFVVTLKDIVEHEDATHWHPVFAPDSQHFAVVRSDGVLGEGATNIVIEIRDVTNQSVVGEYVVPGIEAPTLRLSDWFVVS